MCVHGNEATCHPVWLIDEFLIVFGQQWSNGTEEEDTSGFDTHTQYLLVDTFTVGFGLHMGFVNNKKNIKYHQIYPLTSY